MKLETFFERFDQLADAPDAVAKMRTLVLEWAATGKLCPNPSVEWKEVVLGDVIELISGQHLLADEQNEEGRGIPYLTGPSDFGDKHPIATRWTDQPKVIAQPGDILITVKGSGCGKTNLLTERPTAISRQLMAIRATGADSTFIHVIVKRAAEHFQNAKTGIAIPGIGRKEVLNLSVIIPPLVEQKRIVAKVDELMALCDQLEAQEKDRQTQHTELVRASLARFAEAPTQANLNFLFHKSYNVAPAEIRKSILSLAVQGKLVSQNPADGTASMLIDQINVHKLTLSNYGKFRGQTSVTPMPAEEGGFALPSTWTWVRFGEIMINRDGERIPVSREDRALKEKTYDYYGASGVIDKIDGYLFDKPLLLVGEDGANLINRSTPIAFIARGKYWVNNHAHVLDGISEEFLRYIEIHINAIDLEPYITGSAQPKMNQAKMNSIPIALPPLPEQSRIVAKVHQLMAIVDQLETHLAVSRTIGAKLIEAVVAELAA
jgi:type I restriction enzyme S subunit